MNLLLREFPTSPQPGFLVLYARHLCKLSGQCHVHTRNISANGFSDPFPCFILRTPVHDAAWQTWAACPKQIAGYFRYLYNQFHLSPRRLVISRAGRRSGPCDKGSPCATDRYTSIRLRTIIRSNPDGRQLEPTRYVTPDNDLSAIGKIPMEKAS